MLNGRVCVYQIVSRMILTAVCLRCFLSKGVLTVICLFQMFLRDAKQAEVLLNQQENFLSKEDVPVSPVIFTCHYFSQTHRLHFESRSVELGQPF